MSFVYLVPMPTMFAEISTPTISHPKSWCIDENIVDLKMKINLPERFETNFHLSHCQHWAIVVSNLNSNVSLVHEWVERLQWWHNLRHALIHIFEYFSQRIQNDQENLEAFCNRDDLEDLFLWIENRPRTITND